MTDKPSPPAPPPGIVDQALALLLKAMGKGQPGDEKSQDIESKMTHLDRLAWRHQVAGDALQVAAQKRAALFRRQRNALIPINHLPSELLSLILINSVDDYQLHKIWRLQMLAQVAWQWWQTIKFDPRFWTYIAPPMQGVELRIRRAGILPLRLDWPLYVGVKDRDAFKNLLQRHAGRWTGIDLKHDGDPAGLQALCTSHFPHLKYLRVHPPSEMMSENWRFNLEQSQNLQEVRLPIIPYLPVTPSSNSPIHLRTLHLDLGSMDPCSSHDLEFLLRLTPQLVELKVENLLNDTNPPAPLGAPIIELPNLRYLKFTNTVTGDEREWIPLLAQIRAPQLENLDLFYGSEPRRRWLLSIGGQVIFTVLATWPSASTNRPEDAPLHSVLRNAGPSTVWRVKFREREIIVGAEGSGLGRLDIKLDDSLYDELPGDILTHLAPFALPVDLYLSFRDDETLELESWDEVLDATPSLRTFEVWGPRRIAREVMDRLSTKAPSPNSTGPRAPHLERLSFRSNRGKVSWSEDNEGEVVKTMLDRRRDAFIQGGILDPPKLAVTGPRGLLFDESESRWLDSESSNAQRGL